jgi:hypothetical protein
MSVREIGSLLTSRFSSPRFNPKEEPPHRQWNTVAKAMLVILWGILVYPQLDPDLKTTQRPIWIHMDQLIHQFGEYLGEKQDCLHILDLLRQHDYIRIEEEERIVLGTGLLVAVDAAKMYRYFRSSVLARQIFQCQMVGVQAES